MPATPPGDTVAVLDRHVAAVAVKANAQVIVPSNLKDFPRASLSAWGIEAQHPDRFLMDLYNVRDNNWSAMCEYLEYCDTDGIIGH